MSYFSIGEFAKKIGVTIQTLRNWDKSGKLKPSYISKGGFRYYSDSQLKNLLGLKIVENKEKIVIGYCRVSSNKQKNDLERQVENVTTFMLARGYKFKIITDIGSGINYNNKGLNEIINLVMENEVEKIVILYKDILVRFGYELVENICNKCDTEIEIIDNTEKTQEQELVEDLIEIVTVFSCRLQGKRANRAKKIIKELIEDDSFKQS